MTEKLVRRPHQARLHECDSSVSHLSAPNCTVAPFPQAKAIISQFVRLNWHGATLFPSFKCSALAILHLYFKFTRLSFISIPSFLSSVHFRAARVNKGQQKALWAKPQSTDEDWKENFRMTRALFLKSVLMMALFISPSTNCAWPPVALDKRVDIGLHKMDSCVEYKRGCGKPVHKSAIKKCLYMFCSAILKNYLADVVCLPSAKEAAAIAGRFENVCHIPQIFGSIEGTHMSIQPPAKGYQDFINRKMWASYNTQAAVDDRGLQVLSVTLSCKHSLLLPKSGQVFCSCTSHLLSHA